MQNQRKYAAEQEWLQPQETQRFHHSGCGAPHSSPCLDRHSGDSSDHTFVHCAHRLLAQPHGSDLNPKKHSASITLDAALLIHRHAWTATQVILPTTLLCTVPIGYWRSHMVQSQIAWLFLVLGAS